MKKVSIAGHSTRPFGLPAASERRGDLAYAAVREMIVSGTWRDRQLTETDLAEQLKMSRTPVREALLRLASEGYVTAGSGRGYHVIELSDQDVVNVYRVRAVLEGLAAKCAAMSLTRAALGELEDLFEEMERARAQGDNKSLAMLNGRFHQTIAKASGNTYLEAMLDNIYDVFERFRPVALIQPGRRDLAAEEHGQLIIALRDGEPETARRLAEEHVEHALSIRQAATRESEVREPAAE